MRRRRGVSLACVTISAGLLLAGCEAGPSRLTAAAEKTRMRTEHMMDNAIAASNAKQARIFAEAAGRQQRRQEVVSGPRYELRRDRAGASWMVYDNVTDGPAKVGDNTQIGLSRAAAEGAIANMQDSDDPTPFYRK